MRQSERARRGTARSAAPLGDRGSRASTLLREDGIADLPARDRRRRHRLRDHARRPRQRPPARTRRCTGGSFAALGATPPEFVHHGLILGEDGTKLSKRADGATSRRCARRASRPRPCARYLEELGLPRHDVQLDLRAVRRLVDRGARGAVGRGARGAASACRSRSCPVLRGARDLVEAREYAALDPRAARPRWTVDAPETLDALPRARRGAESTRAKSIVRELKAVGGDLKALRLALTGRERGPELAAVSRRCPRDELAAPRRYR